METERRRARVCWMAATVAGFAVIGLWALAAVDARADTPLTLDVTVRGPIGGAADDVNIGSMTYDEAVTALTDAANGSSNSATVPIAPTPFTSVTAIGAELHFGDTGQYSLAARGDTTLLGQPAEMVVTAVWADAADTSPETAILFSFGAVNLSALTSFDVPFTLTDSWVGITTTDQTVEPAALPADVADFFDDGLSTTDDAFAVVSSGVAFRGVIDATGGVLGDAANEIGLAGTARIDGTLTADIGALNGSGASSAGGGLSLTATLPTGTTSSLPDWFTPTGNWVLSIDADTSGAVSVQLTASADVEFGGATHPVTATVGIAWDGSTATFSLDASIGNLDNLFGADWLDLDDVAVALSFSTSEGISGSLTAAFDLHDLTGQDATATVTLTLQAGSGGAAGTLEIETDVSLSLSDLATTIGATDADVPDNFDVTVNGFDLFVGFGTGSPSLTIAVTTNVVVDVNGSGTDGGEINSDVLFRLTTGGGAATEFGFGVKPHEGAPDVTVGQLLGTNFGDTDITLPRFTVTIANADLDVAADDLDGPTAAYLGDGVDLHMEQGAVITADVEIPTALQNALAAIGITTEGDLKLEGKLPVLGATELTISIELPTIVAPGCSADPSAAGCGDVHAFRSGTLSIVFTQHDTAFSIGLEGTATVGVPRTDDSSCSADDGYAGACTDELTFGLSASLVVDAGSVGFKLEGNLTTDDGWDEPFGIEHLTIHDLAVELEVKSTPPEVTFGIKGHLTINGDEVLVSFKLGLLAEPPFINPIGFTFGAAYLDLVDLVSLEEMAAGSNFLPASLPLPDLWLKNVWVSFGQEDDPDLCIRPGFTLTGELHVGGTRSGTLLTDDDCASQLPIDPTAVTESCAGDSTCVAAILLDINTGIGTGTPPSLSAAGYFAKIDLGPLHFDPTRVELELSQDTQRLYVSAGAWLANPFDTSDNPAKWASGSLTLDFTPTHLKFDAEIDLADGKALHIKATGEASLSLSNPEFTVNLEFRSDLLDTIADEIDNGINELVSAVHDFAARLADARDPDDVNLWRNLEVLLEQDGTAPQWLIDIVDTFADIEQTISDINRLFTDAGLPPPIPAEEIEDIVLQGFDVPGFPGVPSIEVLGVCLGFEAQGGCWLIPPSGGVHIPGLCDDPGFGGTLHAALCTDLSKTTIVGELFEDELANLGLDVPTGRTGVGILDALQPKLTGSGVDARCGHATAVYADHTIGDTELTLDVAGTPVVFDVPLDLVGTNGFDPDHTVLPEVFLSLLGINHDDPAFCTPSSVALPAVTASVTVTADPTELDEGGEVTVTGHVDVIGATTVDIDWGDATSSSTATIDDGGNYTATHTYTDDLGFGTSTTYTIKATAGTAQAITRVTVRNVAPTVAVALSAGTISEGDDVTATVTFTDPGADTHTVTLVWSDGFRQTASLSGGSRSHVFTRTVADDDPTATASDSLSVTATVRDDDGGTGSTSETLTVDNVAPTDVTLTPIAVLDGEPEYDGEDLLVNEGQTVRWTIGFSDVGVRDYETVVIEWGDGSSQTLAAPATGATDRTIDTAHEYMDDNPTGSPSDRYTVTLTVTDDDTGTTSVDVPVIVHNVAPTIDSLTVTPASLDEGNDVTVDLEFSDPGADSHTVTIDWGDGWVEGATDPDETPTTVVEVAAGAAGATRAVSETRRYGDDGSYTITVTVVDDDTGTTSDTRTITVLSVDPTHAINDATTDGAVTTDWGGQVFIAEAGEDVTVSDTATDPGSDDLTFAWEFGDGAAVSNTSLVGVPAADVADLAPSPQVAPREGLDDVTDEVTHAYDDACLYGVSVQVTDDDGGDGGTDSVAVVIQAAREAGDTFQRNHGQWRDAIREGEISTEQLACYLDIAGYLSGVFVGSSEIGGAPWAPTNGTVDITVLDETGVPIVLTEAPGHVSKLEAEQVKLDRSLLSGWLNFADGAWSWDTLIEDSDGDGVLDTTFAEVMAEVEYVRNTSEDPAEVADARQRLWRLGIS